MRQTRKPFYRMKKEKKITNKKKEETESEKQDLEDDGKKKSLTLELSATASNPTWA